LLYYLTRFFGKKQVLFPVFPENFQKCLIRHKFLRKSFCSFLDFSNILMVNFLLYWTLDIVKIAGAVENFLKFF